MYRRVSLADLSVRVHFRRVYFPQQQQPIDIKGCYRLTVILERPSISTVEFDMYAQLKDVFLAVCAILTGSLSLH
jgi:hypothetical protein